MLPDNQETAEKQLAPLKQQIAQRREAKGIFILLLEGDEFVFAATDEIGTGSLEGQWGSARSGVAGEVIDTGRPILVTGEETKRRIYRRVETGSTLSSDATNFYVTNRVEGYEGHTRVFTKSWTEKIVRDLV